MGPGPPGWSLFVFVILTHPPSRRPAQVKAVFDPAAGPFAVPTTVDHYAGAIKSFTFDPYGIQCIIHVPYIISFSKMYKHKSGWQKTKERAVTYREPRPYQKTKNLAFFTNTFTDIARILGTTIATYTTNKMIVCHFNHVHGILWK